MIRGDRIRVGQAIGLALWLATASLAANAENGSPTENALDDSVWYDAELREVLPVHVEPIADDSLHRDSRWLPKAERVEQSKKNATAGGGGAGGGGGGGLFGSGLTIGNLFGWLLLIAIIVAAVAALAYAFSRTEVDFHVASRSRSNGLSSTPDQQTIERMKHLPAELRRTDVNLRSEAQRLMNQGKYDQAIILLFGHQLLLLDHVGMLRLNRGKTNRKYVRETRTADVDAAQRLQGTVNAFERSYFGGHTITHQQFADLWQVNAELEQAIEQREVAA